MYESPTNLQLETPQRSACSGTRIATDFAVPLGQTTTLSL
jgi:hypothetical protein